MRASALALLSIAASTAHAGVILPDEGGAPLALRREVVTVAIDDQLARTTVDQVFENRTSRPVDGTYTFPVPDGAAVAGFATWVDGRRVESRMAEKHEAEQEFDAARSAGRASSLLEVGGPNRFTSRVANVGAGQTRRLELSYDEVLRYDSGQVSFVLPLTIRHLEAGEIGELTLDVTLRDQREIGDVTSPTAGVVVTRVSPNEVRVRYTHESLTPKADLRIDYKVRTKDVGIRFIAHRPAGSDDGYFLLAFAPKEETTARDVVNRDVVFVFDISGSMAGKKIEQARRALLLCLDNLHSGDRFDVVAFDDRVQSFRPSVVPVAADTLQAARTFVADLHDRGGTDIDQALVTALGTFEPAGEKSSRPRTILFLTDGQATSGETRTMPIVDDVLRSNLGDARIFTFGVGPDVNHDLLERIATNNRGAVEYIDLNEGIDARVGAFYARTSTPLLSNLSVSFGGRPVELTYPHTLPDLYKGLELTLVGRYGGVTGESEITLKGDLNGERKSYRMKVQFPSLEEKAPVVARLWASRRVEALLVEVRLEGETPERKREITELATRYNIATPYTSFVADNRKALASLSPDRVQPGDPEIDIHAPANARSVTLVFPFGLTKSANWESARATWTCRFLVPRDAADGVYDVQVIVTLADRTVERLALSYVVDTTAPVVEMSVKGVARPGRTVELIARQKITAAEVKTSLGKVRFLADVKPDVKSLVAVGPDGALIKFQEDRVGRWHAHYAIPNDAHDAIALTLRVVDVADNAAEQQAQIEVNAVHIVSR